MKKNNIDFKKLWKNHKFKLALTVAIFLVLSLIAIAVIGENNRNEKDVIANNSKPDLISPVKPSDENKEDFTNNSTTEDKLEDNDKETIENKENNSSKEDKPADINTVEKPSKPAEKPSKPAEKPSKPVEKPSKPLEKPSKPVEKPSKPVEKPSKPVQKPSKPVQKPSKPVQKPSKPVEKPAEKPKPEPKPKPQEVDHHYEDGAYIPLSDIQSYAAGRFTDYPAKFHGELYNYLTSVPKITDRSDKEIKEYLFDETDITPGRITMRSFISKTGSKSEVLQAAFDVLHADIPLGFKDEGSRYIIVVQREYWRYTVQFLHYYSSDY